MAEKKINGRTFRVAPLLATQAIVLQARLLKVAGPAIGHLGAALDRSDTEKANSAALKALASIFEESEPVALAQLVKDVVESAQILRQSGAYDQVDFDGDFTGYQKDIIPVVLFVLQEQFGDFFSASLALGNRATKPVA